MINDDAVCLRLAVDLLELYCRARTRYACVHILYLEIIFFLDLKDVIGDRLNLPKASLTSDSKYWVVSSFHLPWFDLQEKNHPHVIAAGNTFVTILTDDCRHLLNDGECINKLAKETERGRRHLLQLAN